MTYAYCLFFCFENAVRDLVAQRLNERKGPNWWTTAVPSKVQQRVEGKKNEIEENKWHQTTIGADINHTLLATWPRLSFLSGKNLTNCFQISIGCSYGLTSWSAHVTLLLTGTCYQTLKSSGSNNT